MPKSKNKRKKARTKARKPRVERSGHTPIARHRRDGNLLRAWPSEMNIQSNLWDRDSLPDYLWLASLVRYYGSDAHRLQHVLLDTLAPYVPEDSFPPVGLVSNFDIVPPAKRADFLRRHKQVLEEAIITPFGNYLSLYPEAPGYWMLAATERNFDHGEETLASLSQLVLDMLPGRGDFCGHVRVLPLARAVQQGRIVFPQGFDIEPFVAYPHGTPEETARVQSFARAMLNGALVGTDYDPTDWAKHFWRTNMTLVQCKPVLIRPRRDSTPTKEQVEDWYSIAAGNASIAAEYIRRLRTEYQPDLYDPTRDEVLLGLYSRLTRLYTVVLEDPSLWARDLYNILMRCMVDTAVTFKYLAGHATPEEFKEFIEYSDGKRKLLMLHLQDEYQDSLSTEGATSADISSELGGFSAELLNINLGGWTKKSFRKLAFQTKMERYYRLVYSPASEHVHGNWTSLKHANLCHCGQALHRFHRLPAASDPPLYLEALRFPQELLLEIQAYSVDSLGFPQPETRLAEFITAPSDDEE